MDTKQIITIGRQVGSGGRLVGKLIADRLGLPFFDREILLKAAEESGIKGHFFEKADEKNDFFSRLTSYLSISYLTPGDNCLSSDSLFKFQSDAMRKAAMETGGVFVGRCSDYVLREFKHKTDIFITAEMEERITRAMYYYTLERDEAIKKIADMEQARREYYNFFTNKNWGVAESYDLCFNSSGIDLEYCADLIIKYIQISGR